jgi:DNA-binding winged helix-turn-helix (wHTH) protein
VYRFAAFLLDAGTRRLFENRAEVHLSPKAFDLLVFLVNNRSRAVSKAELQQHLWPTTFVEETNIASLIAEVRRALRDSASSPVLVRTVYAFGYQFVGDVIEAPGNPLASGGLTVSLVSTDGETKLVDGVNIIGRGEDATVRIDSAGVSRCHARIRVAGGEATLEDAGSKNGTYLNGVRVTAPAPLANGNEIRIGSVVLTFAIATPTSPTATVPPI